MVVYPCRSEQKISADRPSTLRLRLLATSDLHMQVLDYDYVQDRPSDGGSLAKLARLIEQARADTDICLLVDNGDTLQGTPVADYLLMNGEVHANPMALAMNRLRYDVMGLGNHDLDFGIGPLADMLKQFDTRIVSSNVFAEGLPMVRKSVTLEAPVRGPEDTTVERLRIGFVSALPAATASWNRHHLADQARIDPALDAIIRAADELRQAGADIVVALAHMGITMGDDDDNPQNQIIDVAKLPQIDAVVGGHTHLRFPGPDYEDTPGIDCARGMIGDTPVVQPGTAGSDLGQIDLELVRQPGGWRASSCRVALRSALPGAPEDPELAELAAPAHIATRNHLATEVGQIANAMNSYFALALPSPVIALIGSAMASATKSALERGQDAHLADLPLLSATSADATGGLDGPQNFVSLAAGIVRRRHVAGLNRYANQVWAVRTTGARVLEWLERSALIFNQLDVGKPDQLLINPKVAGFRFDTIFGLTYQIDPTQPAAYDIAGRRCTKSPGRVRNIHWQGKPLDPAQEFIVAASDHRVGGGGAYPAFAEDEIVLRGSSAIGDALLSHLKDLDCAAMHRAQPWRFADKLGVSAILQTAPAARHHLEEIALYSPQIAGTNSDGFLKVRLYL